MKSCLCAFWGILIAPLIIITMEKTTKKFRRTNDFEIMRVLAIAFLFANILFAGLLYAEVTNVNGVAEVKELCSLGWLIFSIGIFVVVYFVLEPIIFWVEVEQEDEHYY